MSWNNRVRLCAAAYYDSPTQPPQSEVNVVSLLSSSLGYCIVMVKADRWLRFVFIAFCIFFFHVSYGLHSQRAIISDLIVMKRIHRRVRFLINFHLSMMDFCDFGRPVWLCYSQKLRISWRT